MRGLRVLLPFAVLAAGIGGGTAAAEAPERCEADVIVSANDLHVSVDPVTEVVQAGQRARFEVTVSRPGGNPAGVSMDLPARVPAAGVRAAVWIPLAPTPAAALGETGDDGTAMVEVPIPSNTKGGTVDIRGFSWNTIISGYLTLEEVGQVDLAGALTIKPRRR